MDPRRWMDADAPLTKYVHTSDTNIVESHMHCVSRTKFQHQNNISSYFIAFKIAGCLSVRDCHINGK
jgi:hypothetical protein